MTNLFINQTFKAQLTPSDILSSEGTIFFEMPNNAFEHEVVFFKAENDNFIFAASLDQTGLILTRNETTINLKKDLIDFSKRNFCKLCFRWDPIEICIVINCYLEKKITNSFSPPVGLIKFARKQLLLPVEEFKTKEEFVIRINEGLQIVQEKISQSTAYTSLWDKTYGPHGKITQITPKRETDVHPILHCFLSDQMLLSNIEIIPEFNTGIGNVDFAFIGNVANEGMVKMFVELKNGHSKDLEHGYTHQLPLYLQNSQVEYGTYCVLCYHGEWFDVPKSSTESALDRLYEARESVAGINFDNIRIIALDLSKPKSASSTY